MVDVQVKQGQPQGPIVRRAQGVLSNEEQINGFLKGWLADPNNFKTLQQMGIQPVGMQFVTVLDSTKVGDPYAVRTLVAADQQNPGGIVITHEVIETIQAAPKKVEIV